MPFDTTEKPEHEDNIVQMKDQHEGFGDVFADKPEVDAVTFLKAANPELFHEKKLININETSPQTQTIHVHPRTGQPIEDGIEMTGSGTVHNEKPKLQAYNAEGLQPLKRTRKIAIIGTAPQWQLAPFDDPSWEIWGIFGTACAGKRMDRIYEMHDKAIIQAMAKQLYPAGQYYEAIKKQGKNFISKDAFDEAPEGTRFDFKAKLDKYGPYFASSAAWLLADAIDQEPAEIGLWGINMAAEEEYGYQKPSMSYLLGWAKRDGIKLVIPSSSELLSLTHQYGLENPPRFLQCMAQKRAELEQQLGVHRNNQKASEMGAYGCEQALAMLKFFEQNWKA